MDGVVVGKFLGAGMQVGGAVPHDRRMPLHVLAIGGLLDGTPAVLVRASPAMHAPAVACRRRVFTSCRPRMGGRWATC